MRAATLIQSAKYKVSWQFVSIKARRPRQGWGVEAAVVGVAWVATARGPRLHFAAGASDRENRYRSPWPRRKLTGQEKRNPAARLRTVDRQAAPHHYDRPCQRSRGEWFGCGHITERGPSAGLRIDRRTLAKRAAGRRAGERGRPPRTRVRGGDAG